MSIPLTSSLDDLRGSLLSWMECKGLHSVEHFPLSQWPSGHSRLGFQSFGIYHSSIQSGVQLQSKRVILPPCLFSLRILWLSKLLPSHGVNNFILLPNGADEAEGEWASGNQFSGGSSRVRTYSLHGIEW